MEALFGPETVGILAHFVGREADLNTIVSGVFRKLAQIIVRVLRRQMARQLSANRKELLDVVKPRILMTQHSFSSDLSFHPHWHVIVSDGLFTPEGDFIPLWNWDTQALLEDLRASILRALSGGASFPRIRPGVFRNGSSRGPALAAF